MTASNFHTHTTYCDGKDTPEQMIERAIELGCPSIGFSGHSYTPFDTHYQSMNDERAKKYREELLSLRDKYRGKIKIYIGIEQDYYSTTSTDEYDYVIGSVHYNCVGGDYMPIDRSGKCQLDSAEKYYGGDIYSYIEDYYSKVADVYNRTKCDIIGHFDLVTKFNEDDCLFDTKNPRYIAAAEKALDSLLKTDCIFEINSGAISRGYRKTPYPQPWIVEKIRSCGGRIIYTSDCHDRNYLLLGLPEGETAFPGRKNIDF